MPARWLQEESCRVGFKSHEKASCSVFYPSKNELFSQGTMNTVKHKKKATGEKEEETHYCSKVITE